MRKEIQAYFIDLDGTLLDLPEGEETLSSANVKAVVKLNKNKPVIISTGRSNSEFVLSLVKLLKCPYAICQNGALIVDKKNKVLARYEMEQNQVDEIVKLLKEEEMFFIFNGENKIYCNYESSAYMRPWTAKLEKLKYSDLGQKTNVTKILTFGKDEIATKNFKNFLAKKYPSLAFHIVSKGYSIEITHKNATKGKGAAFVCDLLKIDPKNAAHIGDSGNDLNALPEIGTFIAMENAMDEVKEVAHYIGPSFENSGIAKLFKDLKEI